MHMLEKVVVMTFSAKLPKVSVTAGDQEHVAVWVNMPTMQTQGNVSGVSNSMRHKQ